MWDMTGGNGENKEMMEEEMKGKIGERKERGMLEFRKSVYQQRNSWLRL
jgi:hypothetical protein